MTICNAQVDLQASVRVCDFLLVSTAAAAAAAPLAEHTLGAGNARALVPAHSLATITPSALECTAALLFTTVSAFLEYSSVSSWSVGRLKSTHYLGTHFVL